MVYQNRFILAALRAVRETGFDPRLKAHVGAVITRGGSIISVATNTYGTDPYTLARTENGYVDSVHAEVNAIMRVRHKVDLDGTKMWVVRLTKPNPDLLTDSMIALAEPCNVCKNVIMRHGIRRVYYTIDEQTTACWRVPRIDVPRKHRP